VHSRLPKPLRPAIRCSCVRNVVKRGAMLSYKFADYRDHDTIIALGSLTFMGMRLNENID
jgi:hypothetical protein